MVNVAVETTSVDTGCSLKLGCDGHTTEERTIGFDEFFNVMVKKMKEERAYAQDIIFESSTDYAMIA